VAVAAGYAPIGVGTDTGGSIRGPAAANGIAALKPTRGLIPVTGLSHLSWTLDSIGQLATNAADLARLTETLAGPDNADADSLPLPPVWSAIASAPDLSQVTLGLPDDTLLSACTPPVRAAFDALVARARHLLQGFESDGDGTASGPILRRGKRAQAHSGQVSLFDAMPPEPTPTVHPALLELQALALDTLSPLEALQTLYALQKQSRGRG
jgi:hypothetical protein